jgi:DNA (cytosine-5)-methyltransferase 1
VKREVFLDLYSNAGGAGMGYHRAGFDVIGVDIAEQPRYPFEFHQADAIEVLDRLVAPAYDDPDDWLSAVNVVAVHASPPCQPDSSMTKCRPGLAETYARLIGPTRERLKAWGGPWVMENVEGSGLPAQDDLFGAYGLMLCGLMVDLELYRHRYFETSFPIAAPHHPRHLTPASSAGHWEPGTIVSVAGHSLAEPSRRAMGIDWMTREELSEAIPPAFAEYIAQVLRASLGAAA